MELVINGQAIKTTAEHPFYVPAQERFVSAGELQVGDLLVSSQGTLIPIESISQLNEITAVYNLRVADHHTYFVGGALWGWDVWVHNASYQRVSATNDLAQIAADYRKNLVNPYTGRNIMVYEYIDEAGNLAVSALMISRGKHTEKMIPEGTLVTRIFSESEPCRACNNHLEKLFPTAHIEYLFPYHNKATRVPSHAIKSYYKKLFGDFHDRSCIADYSER